MDNNIFKCVLKKLYSLATYASYYTTEEFCDNFELSLERIHDEFDNCQIMRHYYKFIISDFASFQKLCINILFCGSDRLEYRRKVEDISLKFRYGLI